MTSNISEVQKETDCFISLSKGSKEKRKIDGVGESDYILTVVGPISSCAKALVRIAVKAMKC